MMTESNRRHSACKADALPTELITLVAAFAKTLLNQKSIRRASFIFSVLGISLQTPVFKRNNFLLPACDDQNIIRLKLEIQVGAFYPACVAADK